MINLYYATGVDGIGLTEFVGWVREGSEYCSAFNKKVQSSDLDHESIVLGYRDSSETTKMNSSPKSFERYDVVFNGTILDAEKCKVELIEKGYVFSTNSDEELINHMFTEDHTDIFKNIRGFYSLLIWDRKEATLYGARDGFGVKPLFYNETPFGFVCGSQKGIVAEMTGSALVDTDALQQYMSFQYVPEPFTMTQGLKKIPGGHYFIKEQDKPLVIKEHFSVQFQPVVKEEKTWIHEIRSVLYDSVAANIEGEDSIGSLLSGGIDSTIIATIASEIHPGLKTYSVGFEQDGFSETSVAEQTANELGIENIQYKITADDYVNSLEDIILKLEDPLADPACIPLYFAAREASKYVDVAMSGEGADELFGGYNIYREPDSLKVFNHMPAFMKNVLRSVSGIFPDNFRGKSFLERGTTPLQSRYIGNARIFTPQEQSLFLENMSEAGHFKTITDPLYKRVEGEPLMNQMQFIDLYTWSRGDILLKADKMFLANNLELRSPFLDQKVLDVASKIPTNLKVTNKTTKYMLREAVRGLIPAHVLMRRKLGFPVPIRHWLKRELNSWAKNIIHTSKTDYLIKKEPILAMLEAHCENKADYSRKIWTVLIFMIWHRLFIEESRVPEEKHNLLI